MCSRFQWDVYRAIVRVPAGRVITYKCLAGYVGRGSARAVGSALARNPFPVIVPCHRVVRADRSPGRFSPGRGLKKILLELEGVAFDKNGKISKKFFVRQRRMKC